MSTSSRASLESSDPARSESARPSIQRPRADAHATLGNVTAAVASALSSPGTPLAPESRRFFEPRFGVDFSRVRIHVDDAATRSAHARALTMGEHVVFGENQFRPTSADGRHLLAHELAHVVQQRRGGPKPALDPSAPHEIAADAAAHAVMTAGRAVVAGASGVGMARAPEDPVKSATAVRERIDRATQALDALQSRVDATRKEGGSVSTAEAMPAYDAVATAIQRARAVGNPDLIAPAEELGRRYEEITRNTAAARGVSPFARPEAASGKPMRPGDAYRVVTAQRGFSDGLPAHRLADKELELAKLRQQLQTASTPQEAEAIQKSIDALTNRLAISSPRLKDPVELAQRKADLENQLQAAKTSTDRRRLQRQIAGVEGELGALHGITDPGARPPAAALQAGRIGHSGNTYVTIQIVDFNGDVIATVQARNQGNGGLHAEQVALQQLETFGNKARFEGATMIITGDQEVCAEVCRPVVRAFAEKYKFKEAIGDTTNAPGMTSQGRLTGKLSTAKTTVGKLADPQGVEKIEQAQRAAGHIGADEPVKLTEQRETLYRGRELPRGSVPRSAKSQSAGPIPRPSARPQPGGDLEEGGLPGARQRPQSGMMSRAFRRNLVETLPIPGRDVAPARPPARPAAGAAAPLGGSPASPAAEAAADVGIRPPPSAAARPTGGDAALDAPKPNVGGRSAAASRPLPAKAPRRASPVAEPSKPLNIETAPRPAAAVPGAVMEIMGGIANIANMRSAEEGQVAAGKAAAEIARLQKEHPDEGWLLAIVFTETNPDSPALNIATQNMISRPFLGTEMVSGQTRQEAEAKYARMGKLTPGTNVRRPQFVWYPPLVERKATAFEKVGKDGVVKMHADMKTGLKHRREAMAKELDGFRYGFWAGVYPPFKLKPDLLNDAEAHITSAGIAIEQDRHEAAYESLLEARKLFHQFNDTLDAWRRGEREP